MIFIYTLSSSESPEKIRYVGKTKNIKDRLRRHVGKYYLNLEINYKNNWIKSEISKGNTILINQVDVVTDEIWEEREIYWISYYKNLGHLLTNSTIGGDGINLTDEVLKKRNDSNINRNLKKIKNRIEKYNIRKEGEFWLAERKCECGNIVYYKNKKRQIVINNTGRAEKQNRKCQLCKLIGDRCHFFGKKVNDGTKKREKYGKKILQFDLDDNLIYEYKSIREASEKTGIDRKSISNCARGIKHFYTAHGFKFKIKEL